MNERTGAFGDILDVLTGEKKPTANVITSADETWSGLALNFWLYGILAFAVGVVIWKVLNK